jgi:FtsH-binding integral membrane protein
VKDFQDISSRKGFIRKVYGIFCSQMTCTIAITAIIMNNKQLALYLRNHFEYLSLISFGASTAAALTLVRNPHLRHKAPYNIALVAIHAISQSFMIGTFSR